MIFSTKTFLTISVFIIFFLGCEDDQMKDIDKKKVKASTCKSDETISLGQMMLYLQTNHAKLYYAGSEQNWRLSSFYLHELEETFEKIASIHPEHDNANIKSLVNVMAVPVINDLKSAIESEHDEIFIYNYKRLTNVCNSCHKASEHSFIRIKIPAKRSFHNQSFSHD